MSDNLNEQILYVQKLNAVARTITDAIENNDAAMLAWALPVVQQLGAPDGAGGLLMASMTNGFETMISLLTSVNDENIDSETRFIEAMALNGFEYRVEH